MTEMAQSSCSSRALDESWASLDPSDYSQQDDIHSDQFESGSLADLSSGSDTDSSADDDDDARSNLDLTDLGESDVLEIKSVGHDKSTAIDQVLSADSLEEEYDDHLLTLHESLDQPHDDRVSLYWSGRSYASVEVRSRLTDCQRLGFKMTVSRDMLNFKEQAFHIAYYSNCPDPEAREEIMCKIGAALVLSSSYDSARSSTASSMFSVVPTEFGADAKPQFAGLIPSQARVTIETIMNQPSTATDHPLSIRFGSETGVTYASKPTRGRSKSVAWRPDLVVVLLSDEDVADGYQSSNNIRKLAERHCWPLLVLTESITEESVPTVVNGITRTCILKSAGGGPEHQVSHPINIGNFLILDTEQLNRHLHFITEQSKASLKTEDRSTLLRNLLTFYRARPTVQRLLHDFSDTKFELCTVDSMPSPDHRAPVEPTVFKKIKQSWSNTTGRQTLKDTILTLVVALLSMYIVSFSQGISQRMNSMDSTKSSTLLDQQVSDQSRLASPCWPETQVSSITPSVSQDVVVYDPISFDNVWSRLTAGLSEKEQAVTPETIAAAKVDQANSDKFPSKVTDDSVDIQAMLSNSLTDLREYKTSFMTRVLGKSRRKEMTTKLTGRKANNGWRAVLADYVTRTRLRKEQQAQLEEMDRRLRGFWIDVSNNIQFVGEKSQHQFKELVNHSQQHLRRARWATGKRLEEIVGEQKKLLARAQYQAHLLKREIPKKKRRTFFGKV